MSSDSGKLIRLRGEAVEVLAKLDDSVAAQGILRVLPETVFANLWGEEIYFSLPVKCDYSAMREIVATGDIGYWPSGEALCFFFGPTPISQGDEIRAASAVQVLGKIQGDPRVLRAVKQGEKLTLEIAE
jgi:uncharacterized protein